MGFSTPQDTGAEKVTNENLDVMLPRRRMFFYGLLDTQRHRDRVGFQRLLEVMLPRRRMSFYGLLDTPRLWDRVGLQRN